MRQKIKMIESAQHPHSSEMLVEITALDNMLRNVQIGLGIVGFIVATAMAIRLSKEASEYAAIIYEINFFGYSLVVSSDSFLGSPFTMFLHVNLVFDLIVSLLLCVRMFIRTMLTAKSKMLDTAYQTELLTALLVNQSCNAETPGAGAETEEAHKNPTTEQSAEKKEPVAMASRVFSAEVNEGKICCPSCGKEQPANRNVCWYCGNRICAKVTE